MAADIAARIEALGLRQVDVVGHDIGFAVAHSLAAWHPALVRRLVLLDVAPADASLASWPLLPRVGSFGDKVGDGSDAYPWWFAMHQVPDLHAKFVADGRIRDEQDWMFHYLLKDDASIDARDREVFARARADDARSCDRRTWLPVAPCSAAGTRRESADRSRGQWSLHRRGGAGRAAAAVRANQHPLDVVHRGEPVSLRPRGPARHGSRFSEKG